MAKPDPIMLEVDRYPVRIDVPTRFQDLDPNKHINNVAHAAVFEEVRVRFDTQLGLNDIARHTGMRAMIVSLQIEYLGEAHYPAPITAHVGVLSIGRSSWSVASVTYQESKLVSFMTGTIVNTDSNGSAPLPSPFRDALARHQILFNLDQASPPTA